MIAEQLIAKYNLAADSYYTESPYTNKYSLSAPEAKENYMAGSYYNGDLNIKWAEHIPDGWYGFDIGYPVPTVWYKVIDEFLTCVKEQCPDFEILQQKVKFGGYRCYLNNINKDIQEEIDKLESVLYDEFLVY